MDWKTFVKPDAKKILLALLLLGVSGYAMNTLPMTDMMFYYGFPAGFYYAFTAPGIGIVGQPEISYAGFLIDLLVWYVIACIMIFAYEKAMPTPAKRGRKK
jgi:hypothetical protein